MKKYKMTQEEYNLLKKEFNKLKKMLDNVEIVKPDKGETAKQLISCGLLDDNVMQALFGINYKNILFYNFQINTWNTKEFMGYKYGFHERYVTANVKAFKRTFDELFCKSGLELLACVVMPVSLQKYPCLTGCVINKPVFKANGRGVVGTVVCRDMVSGDLVSLRDRWIGVAGYKSVPELVQAGMSRFAVEGARNYPFIQTLMGREK